MSPLDQSDLSRASTSFVHLQSFSPFLIYTQKLLWTRKPHLLGVRTLLAKGKIGTTRSTLITDDASAHNGALNDTLVIYFLGGGELPQGMLDHVAKMASRVRDT